MGGSTTQPMGASSPMGGAQAPMGQDAPQDMSQFAGNGMMGMMGQRAQAEARLPPGYGPGEGSMPGMTGQQGYPGMDSKAISADPAGFAQNVQGAQRQEAQYPGSTFLSQGQGGQGAPQDMSQFLQGGAGKGSVNPGAPGNYPPPPGYGPGEGAMPGMMGQGAPQDMSQFAGNGMGMMGQQAPQNMPQFLQQNYPAMGNFPQLGDQAGAQGNIPIQAGARAPVAFGAPNPMGAPMLSELVKAPPPPPAPEPDYNNYNNYNDHTYAKSGGAIHPQDSHTVIQNALRLLSNRN